MLQWTNIHSVIIKIHQSQTSLGVVGLYLGCWLLPWCSLSSFIIYFSPECTLSASIQRHGGLFSWMALIKSTIFRGNTLSYPPLDANYIWWSLWSCCVFTSTRRWPLKKIRIIWNTKAKITLYHFRTLMNLHSKFSFTLKKN